MTLVMQGYDIIGLWSIARSEHTGLLGVEQLDYEQRLPSSQPRPRDEHP